jgi:DNA-binding LacI/PurR family transcriptional regulator
MKTPADHKPVSRAIENFEELIRRYAGKRNQALPTETGLARKWNLSSSAVNRAAHQLIGAGKLRREGYKLFINDNRSESIAGAHVMFIAHRSARVSGMIEEAALRGVEIKEAAVLGSDSMRRHLHEAIRAHVDGVIMRLADSGWEWDAEMAELDRLNIPCVVGEESVPNVSIAAEDVGAATKMLAEHLVQMGHKKIALVGSLRRPIRSSIICGAFEEIMLKFGLPESAKMCIPASSHTREGMAGALKKIRARMPDATAVILFDIDILHSFLQATRSIRLSIPNGLSLCIVGDSIDARANEPSITCANFDSKILMHTALDIICRQIASVRQWGRILQRPRLKIEATLRRGGSVRDLGAPEEKQPKPVQSIAKHLWPQNRTERIRAVEQTWLTPHEMAGAAWTGDFMQMDLRGVANRSLHRPHGWLGHLPLQNLAPGIRHIHGVNFDIIDESKNDGRAVLVMQSSRTLPGARNAITGRIELPVERKVKAAYFLHGCGYAADAVPFAWYEFANAGKHTFSIPLVPLGLVDRRDAPDANIQDWWADFPQFDAAHVKHLVLAENGDPYEYERYLYTYEWLNPEPDTPLETLTVRSNSDEPTTLGLLAVTLLLAK